MDISNKITYTFNKFYGNFLREIKSVDGDIKQKIKANYKVIMKNSIDYLTFFWSNFSKYDSSIHLQKSEMLDEQVFKDITLKDILTKIENVSNTSSNITMVWNYIYILSVLSILFFNVPTYNKDKVVGDDEIENIDNDEESNDIEVNEYTSLFDKVISIINLRLRGEDAMNDISDIVDDDIRNILLKLEKVESPPSIEDQASSSSSNNEGTQETPDIFNMFSSMNNSKICDLAKEISNEIDTSDLKLESPQDIMKLMDFSNGNNVLSNIIGKVSSKIQNKI